MSSPQSRFDVFLCHNSQDKPEVKKIALQLQERGLRPWLDEWELRPGHSWQELLEEQIEEIHSAAVFVGSSGIGPWQEREMRAFLSEFVGRRCPVIPVLLANASQEPKLPIFLKAMTWVDFRRVDPAPMERLIWGITGEKPTFITPSNDVSLQLTAQEFFDRGKVKSELGDKEGAIGDYNQAIKLKPDYADAYNGRGIAKFDLGDKEGAIADFNQAIKLNPDFALAYSNRGVAKKDLGYNQGAIADYNQAIQINKNWGSLGLYIAYSNRGIVKNHLGDKQGAIADYNQAIKLNPDYAFAYNNRGIAKSDLGDKEGAIADFNQAIKLNPDLAIAYYNRGNTKSDLGDKQGAIADYTESIKINQNWGNNSPADAYNNRGIVKDDLGDKQGAIDDYNQSIQLKPDFADAYYNRGLAKRDSGDKQGALSDYQTAAKLYQQQGNTEMYQKARDRIQDLQK